MSEHDADATAVWIATVLASAFQKREGTVRSCPRGFLLARGVARHLCCRDLAVASRCTFCTENARGLGLAGLLLGCSAARLAHQLSDLRLSPWGTGRSSTLHPSQHTGRPSFLVSSRPSTRTAGRRLAGLHVGPAFLFPAPSVHPSFFHPALFKWGLGYRHSPRQSCPSRSSLPFGKPAGKAPGTRPVPAWAAGAQGRCRTCWTPLKRVQAFAYGRNNREHFLPDEVAFPSSHPFLEPVSKGDLSQRFHS